VWSIPVIESPAAFALLLLWSSRVVRDASRSAALSEVAGSADDYLRRCMGIISGAAPPHRLRLFQIALKQILSGLWCAQCDWQCCSQCQR